MTNSLGERITKARADLAIDSADLARRIGVREETLNKWESGQSEPRTNKLLQLAGLLEVSLMWLMTGVAGEQEGRSHEFDRLTNLNRKIDRILALQHETTRLLSEVAEEVAFLQGDRKSVA